MITRMTGVARKVVCVVAASSLAVLTVGVALETATPAFAYMDNGNLVTDGGFEATTLAFGDAGTTIPGWTVTAGNVDVLNNGFDGWPSAEGNNFVDLDGYNAGTITQTVSGLTNGDQYLLTYEAAADAGNSAPEGMQVLWGSSTVPVDSYTVLNPSATGVQWVQRTVVVTADGASDPLTFASEDPAGSAYGVMLDAIHLIAASSVEALSVPATSSIYQAGQPGPNAFLDDGGVPPMVGVTPGTPVTVDVGAGATACTSGGGLGQADGYPSGTCSSAGGESVSAPTGSPLSGFVDNNEILPLIGVFASNDSATNTGLTAPATLTFDDSATPGGDTYTHSFASISPALNQVFFIGDGFTSDGTTQQAFNPPAGSSRLYLGFADAGNMSGPSGFYGDNQGSIGLVLSGTTGAGSTVTNFADPAPPTGASATAGDMAATVSWTAPAAGPTPTDYVIDTYTVNADTTTTLLSRTDTQASTPPVAGYTLGGLSNGTTYDFTVQTITADGSTSAESTASNPVTPSGVPTAPGAPVMGISSAGDGTITVNWTAPTSDGGSAVTGYNLYEGTVSGGESSTPVNGSTPLAASAVSDAVSGLTNGSTYYFTVTAVNAIGEGAPSAETSATPYTVPDAPTMGAPSAGNGSVTLSWTAPTFNGGSDITGYNVYEGTVTGLESVTPVNSSPLSSAAAGYTITGLANGTPYFFTVRAINAAGTGAESNEVNATPVAPSTVPGAPSAPTATTASKSSVSLTWTDGTTGGSDIINHQIRVYAVRTGKHGTVYQLKTTITTGSADTRYTVVGLKASSTYVFEVAAENAVGSGSFSVNSNEVSG